ncbi:unnamed protein product [Euphydryas editha]|uniref:Chorion peroxidase n=1 Tax=Euphydryas editha TaxID=104508 RepID=A0AAU9UV84_EUPED|nr:unnamed protein product [Euphydryas editha]
MQRAQTSSERTPLVPPTYTFESSISRSYQKRLRTFQCAICVLLIVMLSISLLITISYNLGRDPDATDQPVTAEPGNLTMILTMNKDIQPILNKKWPLDGPPPRKWVGGAPTTEYLTTAVLKGKEALKKRKLLESTLKPLDSNSPASRAQRAAATSSTVKPLAEAAFAAEEATRVLINGTDKALIATSVGLGPNTNNSFEEPAYCRPPTAPCVISKYRTQDGTCNNLDNPLTWGVANTPFRRVLPADYGDGISSPRKGVDGSDLPSARDVSVTVHRPSYVHDSSFTVMLAVWGQFIDHDITATALSKGENSSSISCCSPEGAIHPECFPVKLDIEDPYYQDYNLTCMEFVRSASAPTCHFGPREQLNQASAFLDGSTVYSPWENKMKQLRAGLEGQLRMLKIGPWELLPPSMDPNDGCNTIEMNAKGRYCFESGDDRANENLHLTTMHLIWARQHNRLAVILQELNPHWDDEMVFQEARRILGAQMQHITYAEFLPLILGQDVMWALNLTVQTEGFSDSYDPTVNPSIANHFSAAAFRFAHTLLPGLIHNVDSNNGTISYTHLHDMLFNPYALYNVDKGPKYAVKSAMDTPVHTVDPHITSEVSFGNS